MLLTSASPGCAAASLVGVWNGPATTVLGTTIIGSVDLATGGTATYTLEGSGTCNGSLVYAGYGWIADATAITFSGTPTCSGTVTCGTLTFGCGQTTLSSTLGICDYSLAAGGDTLVTTNCTNASLDQTWTRE